MQKLTVIVALILLFVFAAKKMKKSKQKHMR